MAWTVDAERRVGGFAVLDETGMGVATTIQREPHPRLGNGITDEQALSNAAHIVKCVNNHDELTKQLAWAIRALEIFAETGPFTPELNKAKAALAKAA